MTAHPWKGPERGRLDLRWRRAFRGRTKTKTEMTQGLLRCRENPLSKAARTRSIGTKQRKPSRPHRRRSRVRCCSVAPGVPSEMQRQRSFRSVVAVPATSARTLATSNPLPSRPCIPAACLHRCSPRAETSLPGSVHGASRRCRLGDQRESGDHAPLHPNRCCRAGDAENDGE